MSSTVDQTVAAVEAGGVVIVPTDTVYGLASAPTEAMFIILGVGPAIFENKEHPFFVWPVRDRRPVR